MIRTFLYLILALSLFAGCGNKRRQQEVKNTNQQEALVRVNKYLVKQDADKVKGYITRHGWNMTETKTGLWYEITEKGNGPKAELGKNATISYKISLLDGTLCYTSDRDGLKEFVIGKGGVEPGLEQGILFLHEGDKARFIMLPHLAYGLIGDENKIPARAIIVYEVQLIKIKDQQ
jgi:FKBP-type peptidyl-prolyl cis-trans isomerase